MRPRIARPIRWLLGSLGALVLLVALGLAAFGYVVGRVPEYRVQLQDWLNDRTGLVVEFSALSARLRLYGPELIFRDAVVRTPDRTRILATAQRGSVGFDIWRSLASGELSAGRFALESPTIGLIRTPEGRIQLLGQSALPERNDVKPFAIEQLPTGRIRVDEAIVSFRDAITGRGPWSLSGISFELTRDPQSLELRGHASLPPALGRRLTFGATVEGALGQAERLVSAFSIEGEGLDLAGFADVLPDSWPAPESGHGSLQVSGAFEGPALTRLSADVQLDSLTAALPAWATPLPRAAPMRPPSGSDEEEAAEETTEDEEPRALADAVPQVVSYNRLAFELRAAREQGRWRVAIDDLDLAHAGADWRADQLHAEWFGGEQGMLELEVEADAIVLDAAWPLLAYLPESAAFARLRALQARGTVHDLEVEFRRPAAEADPRYSVNARLENVSFDPVGRAPGLGGVSAALRMTDTGGEAIIDAQHAHFSLPRLFRDPLAARSLKGRVDWRRGEDGWRLESNEVRIDSADGAAVARFSATLPADGSSPVLDLTAQGTDLDVAAARRYMPAGRLTPRTLEWLDRAFVSGRVASAELELKGELQSFPFRGDEGTFLVRGQVEDAVFDYQPQWETANSVAAQVVFHNEGMRIEASEARVGGLRVRGATAEIADLKEGRLEIHASAEGDLDAGLDFLTDSPLGPRLGEAFARIAGRGGLGAEVDLYLPIKNLAERRVEVRARLDEASVSMRGVNAPVGALSGELTVRNDLLAAAQLRGYWLGGPVEVEVEPRGPSHSELRAYGTLFAGPLSAALTLPASIEIRGSTGWQIEAQLGSGAHGERADRDARVSIASNLEGLAIELPEPIGKAREEARPFELTLEPDGNTALLARGSLGSVRSLVRVRRLEERWTLDRGGIRADGVAPALPTHRGLRLEGALERFVLDDWLALRGDESGGQPLSQILQAANLRIGEFQFAGYRWPQLRGILQATQAGWQIDVSGPYATGQILLPERFSGTQPLRAALERLVLEKVVAARSGEDRALDPRSLPGLEVHVADLRLGSRDVGAVEVQAVRVAEGIRFDKIAVRGESAQAEGRGEWLTTASGPRSSLNARIESTDVAATLRALGYDDFIAAKRGEISGKLSWPGGFDGNILEHASGSLSVAAEAGQIVAVQPGAGRMLGLFSVAALPRRLALDFSDLTEKGLAFDSVHGDFELRDGNAYTDNLMLRGPAAEIGIVGRTGFKARDYDQTAIVTGNLGASLPVAGALAAGPAVGAALLLFSQVFKEPLKGITRGYYRITGPWDDPLVERVSGQQADSG